MEKHPPTHLARLAKVLCPLLAAALLLAGCQSRPLQPLKLLEPGPETGFYQNPLGITRIGDPCVIHTPDGYYLYATSADHGYLGWRSDDLVAWEPLGMVFDSRQSPNSWGVVEYWAPDVVERDGRYYLYYSSAPTSVGNNLRIGVAVADHPAGPFVEAIGAPLFDFEYMTIDADIFVDEDGRVWLYYALDCSMNIVDHKHTSEIYVVELGADMVSVASAKPTLLLTPTQDWELESGDWRWNEGPEMVKHNGLYYLMYSANFYGDANYAVGVAVAESPTGPFAKYEDNPVLYKGDDIFNVSGSGHHSVAPCPDGRQQIAAYHTHTSPAAGGGDRQLNICTIGFDEAGRLFFNGPSTCWMPVPSSAAFADLSSAATLSGGLAADKTNLAKLADGQIAFHKSQTQLDWQGPEGTGEVTLRYSFDTPVQLRSVVLYKPAAGQSGVETARLEVDGAYAASFPPFGKAGAERSCVLTFEPVEASRLTITLQGNRMALSEILLCGQLG